LRTTELIELINKLPADKQKEIEQFIGSLIAENSAKNVKRTKIEIKAGFGGGKGIFGEMADDFDEPLKEFKDYM
jgi:hypothetical protein